MTASGWLVLLVVALVCLEAGRLIRRLCRNLPTSADSRGHWPIPDPPTDRAPNSRYLEHARIMEQLQQEVRNRMSEVIQEAKPQPPPCYWDAPEPWTRARSPKTACAHHGGSPWDCPLPLDVVLTPNPAKETPECATASSPLWRTPP